MLAWLAMLGYPKRDPEFQIIKNKNIMSDGLRKWLGENIEPTPHHPTDLLSLTKIQTAFLVTSPELPPDLSQFLLFLVDTYWNYQIWGQKIRSSQVHEEIHFYVKFKQKLATLKKEPLSIDWNIIKSCQCNISIFWDWETCLFNNTFDPSIFASFTAFFRDKGDPTKRNFCF